MTHAFKIAEAAEWRIARSAGAYGGSSVDLADGYIHLSTQVQLAETARRHYAGRDDLVVAKVDLSPLAEGLRWESSRGGMLFPHLYDVLPMAAVVEERVVSVDENGRMIFKDGEAPWP